MNITALIIALFFLFVFSLLYWQKRGAPTLPFSRLSSLKPPHKSLRTTFSFLPKALSLLALLFFLIAFIDPHTSSEKKEIPLKSEGIALYFVLDQSGSMKEEARGVRPPATKLNLLKNVTKSFINNRPNDLIGVLSFARSAQVLAPLTLDHNLVLQELQKLTFVPSKEQEGTAIGYAIYKAVSLINATKGTAFDIKSSVIVLVTDGFQDVNPLDRDNKLRSIDLEEASEFAKENEVKLYVINIEPLLLTEKFAPHRRLLKRITENTGGKLYITEGSQSLTQVYDEINKLETSPIPFTTLPPIRLNSYYPLLISLGLASLALSFLLETTIMRQVP